MFYSRSKRLILKFFFYILSFLLLTVSCQQNSVISKKFTDLDLDGIHDGRDVCPELAGSVFNLGCPENKLLTLNYNQNLSTDSDLDGIPDEKDECPELYGSPFNLGCPFSSEFN